MAVGSVLYFGFFASFTGGWVPVRYNCKRENILLNLVHLIFFLVNLIFPFAVYLIRPDYFAGWFVYAFYILVAFLTLKILNWRIHRAFGKDPEPEIVEEDEEEEDEEGGVGAEDEGRQAASEGVQGGGSTAQVPAVNAGQLHADVEVHPLPVTPGANTAVASLDGGAASAAGTRGANNNKDNPMKEEPLAVGESAHLEDDKNRRGSYVAMDTPVPTSPVHLSASSMDAIPPGGPVAEGDIVPDNNAQAVEHTPALTPFVPHERGSHRQRNCVRPRGTLTAEGEGEAPNDPSISSSTSSQLVSTSRGPPRLERQQSDLLAPFPATLATPSTLATPTTSQAPSLAVHVMNKLTAEGNSLPVEVIIKMAPQVHAAILLGTLPHEWYANIAARRAELIRGHVAASPDDNRTGAIHWIEVDGSWDFYVFEGQSAEPQNDHLNVNDILAMHADPNLMYPDGFHTEAPPTPPHNHAVNAAVPEAATVPVLYCIPGLRRTAIQLTFHRSRIEDYMDRNTSLLEVLSNVFLAVMVSVIAALVFQIGFYQGFVAFLFCWVIGSAHFSLIKSVPCDPASPVPGQHLMAAVSRSVYIIFLGSLALILDAALKTDLSALCVYGYNVNSYAVLMFVRNGLLIFILFLPVLFALGWLPQFDTLVIYLSEQIDINIFGGTAATGLLCAIYGLARSILVTALLWLLGWAAFSTLQAPTRLSCNSVNFSPNMPASDMCNVKSRVALSFYMGALFTLSYVLSRNTSNYQYLWDLLLFKLRQCVCRGRQGTIDGDDPLEKMYRETSEKRLVLDLVTGLLIFAVVTCLNVATTFCHSWIAAYVVYSITCVVGAVLHYIVPQIRKENPWQCCSEPIVAPNEWDQYEITEQPEISPMEHIVQWGRFIEKNILYPLCFLFALNLSAHHYNNRFGVYGAALVMTVVGVKLVRSALADTSKQYLILIFTLLFFNFDYAYLSEGLPLDYFIIAILFHKFYDLFLKVKFVLIYIAPWAISWSSLFHILIHPFLIPHAHMFFFQLLVGAIVNAPLNPIMGSALFILSYVRPIKYWEKNYNTKRGDSSTTRLDAQLDTVRTVSSDKFDSLFYEHLTCVLQKNMAGDLALGRWGGYTSGDIFILTSDKLNALIHIIEVGNGFVTFQLRGLEFRGTYCQQREVEAISESISDNRGCFCFEPGHLPGVLSCNMMVCTRWMTWQVTSSCYTIHGYSITETQANLVFNTYDFKRRYLTYYCKAIIYKLIKFPRLAALLSSEQVQAAMQPRRSPAYKDVDVLFDHEYQIIEDYSDGISKQHFLNVFLPFIEYCVRQKSGLQVDTSPDSLLVALCYSYTVLGRRLFFEHSHPGSERRRSSDNFMNGLHRMFLGDARVNGVNDEWVFNDPDSIRAIIIPAARIAVKVHQDNFALSNPYEQPSDMYEAIQDVEEHHVVTHESDHEWRNAVVTNQPSLLALRYHRTDGFNEQPYKLIRLASKFIKFRVIKLNREGVRSLWTSQQHELIFFQVGDSERGSIQNHKPSLRNIINSSMDPPVGYPIYVSPLQTSYIDGHDRFNSTVVSKMSEVTLRAIKYLAQCCKTCSCDKVQLAGHPRRKPADVEKSGEESKATTIQKSGEVDPLTGLPYPDHPGAQPHLAEGEESGGDGEEDFWKPVWIGKTVMVVNLSEVFESHHLLKWPPSLQQVSRGMNKSYRPQEKAEGKVLHEWRPFHPRSECRSPLDKCVLLVKIEDQHVLVREPGIEATLL